MLFGSFEFLFNHLRLLQIAARAGQDHDRRSEAFRSAVAAAAKAARQHLDSRRGTPSTRMQLQRINHWHQVIYVVDDMMNPMDAKTH